MPRLESLYPKLKKGSWKVNPVSIEFKVDSEMYSAELPLEAKPFIKYFNGSYSLTEIIKLMYYKKITIRFQLFIEVLRILSSKNLFANTPEVINALKDFDDNLYKNKKTQNINPSYFTKERLKLIIQKTPLAPRKLVNYSDIIIENSKVLPVRSNQILIREGSIGDKVYLLLSGTMGVYQITKDGHSECVAVLGDLSLFGESSAILGKKRNANVIAHEDSWVLEVSLQNIIKVDQKNEYESLKSLKTRLLVNQILNAAPIFNGLPSDVIQLFSSQCLLEKISKDEVIIYQNDHVSGQSTYLRPNMNDNSFYFLLSGQVEILKNGKHICHLERGSYFGEVGALNDVTRTASVRTTKDCQVLKLDSKSLNEVLSTNFQLALKMEKIADKRTKESLETLESLGKEEINDEITDEIDISEITKSVSTFNLDDRLVNIEELDTSDFNTDTNN